MVRKAVCENRLLFFGMTDMLCMLIVSFVGLVPRNLVPNNLVPYN